MSDLHLILQQEQFVLDLLQTPRYQDPRRLAHYEHQVLSQNGEDGILVEIFRRIGVTSKVFVEIGVGNGLENNTAFWLSQGWRGTWFEMSQPSLKHIRQVFARALKEGTLQLVPAGISRENIVEFLESAQVPLEFDLFSLDIDQNTYWAWSALRQYRPRVAVIEYNASFPPGVDWKVEYHPEHSWDGTMYFGASLTALENLGRELGYSLVGCDLHGVNAFFVRSDLCQQHFVEPFDAATHFEPPRFHLIHRTGHPRSPRIAHPG